MNETTVKLQFASSESWPSHMNEDWECTSYTLAASSRGDEGARQTLSLNPDDVLELELEDGSLLLVAAEDADRYLGAASAGSAGERVIQIRQELQLSGSHPPTPSRDRLGSWLLRSLKVFRRGKHAVAAVAMAGAFQDHQLENRRGLFQLKSEQWELTPLGEMPPHSAPSLLFIHGTASSTAGSFSDLWNTPVRSRLTELYQGRIYGFEHRSLTESPVANALAIVESLPDSARLHLVSHSRGGMVGELLARANRVDSEPYTQDEIKRFLEHGQRTGREGYERDAEQLGKLNALLMKKRIRVERFVRVAATARGTTLASGRLDRWATVMLNLLGVGIGALGKAAPILEPASEGYRLLKNFLLAVVKERTDARVLPGLEVMMPDSPLVALLNAPDVLLDAPLHVIAGDFKGDSLLSWLGDCLSERFYGGQTDLVVNTISMSGGARRAAGIWQKLVAGRDVTHFSYFERAESYLPLLDGLEDQNGRFEKLPGPSTEPLARGGVKTLAHPDAPIALMLPGIMGSHLAIGSERIWFHPWRMVRGRMADLRHDPSAAQNAEVNTDGWMDQSYEAFAQRLAGTHEVRPFTYDWRLSLDNAANKFGKELDNALDAAQQRGKPLRIVAHSMGGLVARLALSEKGRWARLGALPGSRLIQFGTPNGGSHSIAAVLTGRDPFVQKIERWCDWKHDMKEFLDIVRDFPGVLELLPWPVTSDDKALDGIDYFDAGVWAAWTKQDRENISHGNRADPRFETAKGAGNGWVEPRQALLATARGVIDKIRKAPLRPDLTLYVAGQTRTPVAVRFNSQGRMEIGWTEQGDGRVPWASGIPKDVPVWYTDAAHGDLLNHTPAFDAYLDLIEHGHLIRDSRAVRTAPAGVRGSEPPVYLEAPLAVHTLYPTDEEVLAAALGGRPPLLAASEPTGGPHSVEIRIHHGSLANTRLPVMVGSYAGGGLRGSVGYLNTCLDGALLRAQSVGCFPVLMGEALFFPQMDPVRKPGGAVVVCLGALGELQPGELTRALLRGFLEYARSQNHPGSAPDEPGRLCIASLLVGTGHGGVTTSIGIICLAQALRQANKLLAVNGFGIQFAELHVFEEKESRAIAAAEALADTLLQDERLRQTIEFNGQVLNADGGYRGLCADDPGDHGWNRVHITRLDENSDALRFTLISDRARNLVVEEPDQRQFVDGLIDETTRSSTDQPGLSRALFELMVPNAFKSSIADVQGVILAVDPHAAAYPWELMRHLPERYGPPLATQIGLIRQLATPHARPGARSVRNGRMLLVADTQSGLAELTGAQEEGRQQRELYRQHGYEVAPLFRTTLSSLAQCLFDHPYQVVHFAAHGVVSEPGKGYTGLVVGKGTYLTSAQISKLPYVPELVFINCCHLGSMAPDTQPRWGALAANLATQFIEMGSKAVVAAGWAVNDAAAVIFASTFHKTMLDGYTFGEAILAARKQTYLQFPALNTWGAYQAYGDERYRLGSKKCAVVRSRQFVHPAQVIAALEQIRARVSVKADDTSRASYLAQLEEIERAARTRYFNNGRVRELLGATWAALGSEYWERTIEHYRAALELQDSSASLRALEQLANLEVRKGRALMAAKETSARGKPLLESGIAHLEQLIRLSETTERLSLLGSGWKRASWSSGSEPGTQAALREMSDAYRRATERSERLGKGADYYPLLNQLDAALLLHARYNINPGIDDSTFAERIAAARQNAEQQNANNPGFFHQVACIDAKRTQALWLAVNDAEDPEALTHHPAYEKLLEEYRALFQRTGSAREHDSVIDHIAWLADLWPETKVKKEKHVTDNTEIKKTLGKLRDALRGT